MSGEQDVRLGDGSRLRDYVPRHATNEYTETEIRIIDIEHRLDEIERALIALYKRTYHTSSGEVYPDYEIPEMAPLLARMKEVKLELGHG